SRRRGARVSLSPSARSIPTWSTCGGNSKPSPPPRAVFSVFADRGTALMPDLTQLSHASGMALTADPYSWPRRQTNMRSWITVLMMGGLALAAPQKSGQADILFERAVQKETTDGDLKAALEFYRQAVEKAGPNRALAARALIRMGQCYEKLGNTDARK